MNQRPSRDDTLMAIAEVIAARGTCSRLQVGAVFSIDGRILVTGYNGAPAGLPHCDHTCNCGAAAGVHRVDCPVVLIHGCTTAEHAERNAIAFAARHGVKLEGSEVHVTHMPCLACSMSLINAGVGKVIYRYEYRIRDGVDLLRKAGVVVDDYMREVVE